MLSKTETDFLFLDSVLANMARKFGRMETIDPKKLTYSACVPILASARMTHEARMILFHDFHVLRDILTKGDNPAPIPGNVFASRFKTAKLLIWQKIRKNRETTQETNNL